MQSNRHWRVDSPRRRYVGRPSLHFVERG